MTKYFITGATGFVGNVLVDELLSHGHEVLALARSEGRAAKLAAKGAEVLRGDLEDLDSLKEGASSSDGTIHLAFIQDFANFDKSCEIDLAATKAMVNVLKGTGKSFIYAQGLLTLPSEIGVVLSEKELPKLNSGIKRVETELFVLEEAKKGLKGIIIRLPPSVHGEGDIQFIPQLMQLAKENKQSYYIEEGKNAWCAVHKKDAASLFRLAAEKGKAGGVYHAVQDVSIETKLIAETLADKLKLTTESLPAAKSMEVMAFLGFAFSMNVTVSSEQTQKELGWKPIHSHLLEDIEANY